MVSRDESCAEVVYQFEIFLHTGRIPEINSRLFSRPNDPYKSLKTTPKAEVNEEAWATLNSEETKTALRELGLKDDRAVAHYPTKCATSSDSIREQHITTLCADQKCYIFSEGAVLHARSIEVVI